MQLPEVEALLQSLGTWATGRPAILGLALVGSWAAGRARPNSDLDLVALTPAPLVFRADVAWPESIVWADAGFSLVDWSDADYGAVWSRHLRLSPEAEVEISFARPTWADSAPLDPGTEEVVRHGIRPVWDPAGIFAGLSRSRPLA